MNYRLNMYAHIDERLFLRGTSYPNWVFENLITQDNYEETRMANHSFITLIESMLLCIICIIKG